MGMLDMKITQDMLNYWKKTIPTYQFAYYKLDDSFGGTLYSPVIKTIGNNAFLNCTNLTNINLPVVIYIEGYAFQNCINLTTVNLPSVTHIRWYAFANCSNLTSVNLPSVTSIRSSVFQFCTGLTTVILGSNLTFIDSSAFQYCSKLATINVIGDENCITAQTLQAMSPSKYNNATIVYNYTPPESE